MSATIELNTLISLKALQPEDYYACVPKAGEWVDVAKLMKEGVSAWSGDGELLGCAGVLPYWPGVGEAWFAMAPENKRHLDAARALRAGLDVYAKRYRRIQADVLHEHRGWARLIGFTLESEMPHYGPNDETYYRFVRFGT